MTQHAFVPSKAWRPLFEDGRLIMTAGADSMFMIGDVAPAVAGEILALWNESSATEPLSAHARSIAEELAGAGILNAPPLRMPLIDVRFVGPQLTGLKTVLRNAGMRLATDGAGAGLICFVRTAGRLADLLENGYHSVETPHLLLDVAYDHTISLGPLVFRGETACFGCLAGRLTHFWGDAPSPELPTMINNIPLLTGLLLEAARGFARGTAELINATVSLDLNTFATTRNTLYRLPMCPGCREDEPVSSGRLPLQWLEEK